MFAVLAGAVRYFVSYILGGLVLKVLLLTSIFLVLQLFISLLGDLLPQFADDTIRSYVSALYNSPHSEFLKYLVYIAALKEGFPMIISAYITRFTIRRLPVVG